jgi:hypothetical protein
MRTSHLDFNKIASPCPILFHFLRFPHICELFSNFRIELFASLTNPSVQVRATTEKFIQRMVNLSQFLLRFVHIWRTLSSKKRLNHTKLYQTQLHRQRKILFESFFNWGEVVCTLKERAPSAQEGTAATAHTVEQRRLTQAAGKITMAMIRWQKSLTSVTFTSWRTVVVRNVIMERLAKKLVNRWKTMVLSGCMNRWHRACRYLFPVLKAREQADDAATCGCVCVCEYVCGY